MLPTRLSSDLWMRANQYYYDLFLNTIFNKKGKRYADLEDMNELFRSLQIHIPRWLSGSVWKMYLLQDQQKICLDNQDTNGSEFIQFKCFPDPHIFGRKPARNTLKSRRNPMDETLAREAFAPGQKDKILSVWRIWFKTRPSTLSRYPFRLYTEDSGHCSGDLFRPTYSGILVERLHSDKTYEVTGRCICG